MLTKIAALKKYYTDITSDINGRYRSWEHCYYQFATARERATSDADIDFLSLHLAFYLASWGMYRGSSFLLQKSYQVHIPAVRLILSEEYDRLLGIACEQIGDDELALIFELSKKLSAYYDSVRKSLCEQAPQNELSHTLITKILMGTLGCVPAYDRFFCAGVKETGVSSAMYTRNSIRRLIAFYKSHTEELESARGEMAFEHLLYPQMKIIDMIFWQIGFDLDQKKE